MTLGDIKGNETGFDVVVLPVLSLRKKKGTENRDEREVIKFRVSADVAFSRLNRFLSFFCFKGVTFTLVPQCGTLVRQEFRVDVPRVTGKASVLLEHRLQKV